MDESKEIWIASTLQKYDHIGPDDPATTWSATLRTPESKTSKEVMLTNLKNYEYAFMAKEAINLLEEIDDFEEFINYMDKTSDSNEAIEYNEVYCNILMPHVITITLFMGNHFEVPLGVAITQLVRANVFDLDKDENVIMSDCG